MAKTTEKSIQISSDIRNHWVRGNIFYYVWWIDMLMLSDKKGILITTQSELASRLINCTRGKLRPFLKRLVDDEMITIDGFEIKIINYTKYQVIVKKRAKKVWSDELVNLYDELLDEFPEDAKPKSPPQRDGWLQSLDRSNRLEGFSFDDIRRIVKTMRVDEWWSDKFLSMTYLQKTNPTGTKYVIVFSEKLKVVRKSKPKYEQESEGFTNEIIEFED